MKKDETKFVYALIGIILLVTILVVLSLLLLSIDNTNIIRSIFLIILGILIFVILTIIWFILAIFRIYREKKLYTFELKLIKIFLGFIYPLLVIISKIFRIDIDSIRRVYGKINNFLIKTKAVKVKNSEILILLPHCLQESNCKHKITNDINNCKMCGKCDIKDIINISNRYNVKAVVATGGTLAREWIKRYKPKAIIAVACERDLASGINDVKIIPVMGVFNDKPHGPCFNTRVSINKLEEAIKIFL